MSISIAATASGPLECWIVRIRVQFVVGKWGFLVPFRNGFWALIAKSLSPNETFDNQAVFLKYILDLMTIERGGALRFL
ncbi:MAG: hypothetical protein KA152_15205, partial [Verrucomicrobiales bacterium]|nr:hypothetical protein [Verrucomicrobiales bacterium]